MKKLLFGAYSLDLGGIEKALVILVNKLQEKGYDITLVLEKKQGIFLDKINPHIKIIEYAPSESKNILKRKIVNLYKRIKFIIKNKNKFDFSASFATYSLPASFVARTASKNCYLWGHADYLTLFNGNEQEMRNFFVERNYSQFKKIVFVSKEGRDSFIKVFPEMKDRTIVCNNLINAKKIIEMSKEKISDDDLKILKQNEKMLKNDNITTFINVGRHEEKQKQLSKLIDAASLLKKDDLSFRILFVGDGPQTQEYKKRVKEKELENNIIFLGRKQNPYPYFKISDCTILSSDYEGYPVVFLESFLFNKPVITTDVSDYKVIQDGRGIVTEKNTKSIYRAMKGFIEKGYKIEKKFNARKHNLEVEKQLKKILKNS